MTKHVAAIVAVFVAICSIPTLAGSLKDGPATVFVFGDDVEDEGFGFGYQAAFEFKQNFSIEFSGVLESITGSEEFCCRHVVEAQCECWKPKRAPNAKR